MRNAIALGVLSLFGFLLFGCDTAERRAAQAAPAPLLGKGDGGDLADRECQIVLRTITRTADGAGGDATRCTAAGCSWIWSGTVEVADALAGATVRVLYHRADDPRWWQVDAQPAADAAPGFARYSFLLDEHLYGPSTSPEELATARVELVPFLARADGTRVFDHNRRRGDLDTYALQPEHGFAIGDDGSCAPVVGRISFLDNWDEPLFGTLRQGGYLVIDYALERLPQCRGTHDGHPAWDLVAHARFTPGGQLVAGSVRAFESPQGQPTTTAHAVPLTVPIPADATDVELWFRNTSGAGSSCEAFDSSYGANYRFPIMPPADHPRCRDVETWASIYGGTPSCLAYDLDAEHDADHCEVFLSGIGDGYEGHYGIPFNWVEAFLTVGPQQGELLNAGMLTRYRDAGDPTPHPRYSLGRQVAPDTWKTGFTFHYTGVMGSGSYHHDIEQLAFFVDVRRPTGAVVRLWQSRRGANYTWDDAFAPPTSEVSIPYGRVRYATAGAPILDAQRACAP